MRNRQHRFGRGCRLVQDERIRHDRGGLHAVGQQVAGLGREDHEQLLPLRDWAVALLPAERLDADRDELIGRVAGRGVIDLVEVVRRVERATLVRVAIEGYAAGDVARQRHQVVAIEVVLPDVEEPDLDPVEGLDLIEAGREVDANDRIRGGGLRRERGRVEPGLVPEVWLRQRDTGDDGGLRGRVVRLPDVILVHQGAVLVGGAPEVHAGHRAQGRAILRLDAGGGARAEDDVQLVPVGANHVAHPRVVSHPLDGGEPGLASLTHAVPVVILEGALEGGGGEAAGLRRVVDLTIVVIVHAVEQVEPAVQGAGVDE